MKMTLKRILVLFLAAMLLLTVACSGQGTLQPEPEPSDSQKEAQQEIGETPAEPGSEEKEPGEAQPAEAEPDETEPAEPEPAEEQAVEKNGDIVILYTSDVHCGVDQGFGYAGLEQIRDYLLSRGNDVILVDNGDNIQGEPLGTMSRGEILVDLMNRMGYSIAIPGNHEFDYSMDQFLHLAEEAEFSYISCNFNREGEPVFQPYVLRELAGRCIAFVGVTTPKTLTSSTPGYFKNDAGEFIYGFFQDTTGENLYRAVQNAVDAAREEGAEYVVLMGHLGNEEACAPWTYADVIANTRGIDVMLDGHSHDTDQISLKNLDGETVPRSACGTKLANIGWCRIAADGEISTGLYSWINPVSAPELMGLNNEMADAVRAATVTLQQKLSEVVASSQVDLIIYDPELKDSNGNPVRLIRRMETNLGDFCADAYRAQSGADIAFVNGGGIRKDLKAGNITLNDLLSVFPFGNTLCVVEVTGQQILDALEWGARSVPSETGGFLQVSGISYSVDTTVESSCKKDENGLFMSVEGARRVGNVLVGGEPIDPERTYTLASHNYMLLDNGDGYTMFDGCTLLQDRVKLDNQVLIDYIMDTLGGVIGSEYEDVFGAGRIEIE